MYCVTMNRLEISDLKPRLEEFERAHGMSTSEFLNRWMGGELDSHDYVRWFGLCQMGVTAQLIAPPQQLNLLVTA